MGHAKAEDLLDIADVVDEIRALPGVVERSPGIFYIGSAPFLHFHTRAGERWADAKVGCDWGPRDPAALRRHAPRQVRLPGQRCALATSRAPSGARSGTEPRVSRRRGCHQIRL